MLTRRQLLKGMLGGLVATLIPLPAQAEHDELYISPETLQDIRSWGVDDVDEQTKREILAYTIPNFHSVPSVHIIGDTYRIPLEGKVVNGRLAPA